jgi:O-antigen/teichoic acid export membrane protein
MFAEQMLRMAAGLLVGIWVARYLGPAQFGLFSYAIAFAALFSSIAKLGLDNIMVRDLVSHPEQHAVYLGTAFWLKLMGALVMLGIIGIVMQFTSSDTTTKIYIVIIASGIVFQAFEVVDFYFQSQVLSKFVSICKLTQLFISSLLKLYLIYIGADLFWFVVVGLVDQVTLALTLFIAYRSQKIGGFFRQFDVSIAKRLLHDSWPQILTGLVIMVYLRIDQIMIKEILGEKEVGLYSAAVRLSELVYFIPIIITNSIFPAIIASKKISNHAFYSGLQLLYILMLWLAIVIAIIVTVLSDWLIPILYGDNFNESVQVLQISIWASIFVFYGCVKGRWLIIENMQKYSFICTFIGAITNVIANIILIPIYGIVGASIATLIAHIFSAVIIPLFYKKDRVSLVMLINAVLLRRRTHFV